MRASLRIALGVAGACLIAGRAMAQFPPVTDPNKDEQKCQAGVSKVLVKFVSSKTKCITKCIAAARKVDPFAGAGGCFGPTFSDPATNTCVFDTLKGSEAKAKAGIIKACATDCPECYTAIDANLCTTGQPFTTDVESQIDPFGQLIYCQEAVSTLPSAVEKKCEDTVTKSLVKFVGSKTKCYVKCQGNLNKGKIAPGSCDPPVPSDPATAACIFDPLKGAETKTAAAIDKVCEVAGSKPACYSTITGAGWVALVESNVD